jgi:hypothetical protein
MKYLQEWKQAGHPEQVYPPRDEPTKTGNPEVVIDNLGNVPEQDSELERWGIKKNPLRYRETHNADGSKKE